jgi:hypothetical protein
MERGCGTRFVQGNDCSSEDGLFGCVTDTRWLFRAFMPASHWRRECVTTELGANRGRFRLEKRFDGIHRQRKCLEGGRGGEETAQSPPKQYWIDRPASISDSRPTSFVEPGILYEVPQERDVIKPSRERYVAETTYLHCFA